MLPDSELLFSPLVALDYFQDVDRLEASATLLGAFLPGTGGGAGALSDANWSKRVGRRSTFF